jgi:hypothetical protein
VASQVNGKDPEVLGELLAHRLTGAAVIAKPVQQHQRRGVRDTTDTADQPYSVHRDLQPLAHPARLRHQW